MASSGPVTIYQSVDAISDVIESKWQENQLGPWMTDINVRSYAVSSREAPGAPVFDWHLVEVEGAMSMMFDSGSSWSLAGHGIAAFLNTDYLISSPHHEVPGPFGIPMSVPMEGPDGQLVDHAPSTTVGQSSYSTSMTTTISGSIGFMGEAPTASFGSSVSTTSAKSITVPDLVVRDVSNMAGNNDATWFFEVASGSTLAESDCPILTAFLYRVPNGRPTFDLNIVWSVYLIGGDVDELLKLPSNLNDTTATGGVQVMPGFGGGPGQPAWLQGKARLSRWKKYSFNAPPLPRS